MKKMTFAILFLILLSFAVAFYSYEEITADVIASHWNSEGEIDSYMSKFWGLFLFPLILVGVYLLFIVIPIIDPLKKNIEKFRGYYDLLIVIIMLFVFYVFILAIVANLGYSFNMTVMILPVIGLLFVSIGSIMKKLKRNWFIGIRTPWTLSSDVVWKKTHELGGVLFKVVGVLIVLGIFAPMKYLLWFILVPVLTMVILLVVYSYLEYRKIKK